MKTSIEIARLSGIPIKVHWTFGLLIGFIGILSYKENLTTKELWFLILGIACIFSCVLLHELGHAVVAKKFNIHAKDILLTPIGGLARLSVQSIKPIEEIKIALAGPVVNLVVAGIIFFYIFLKGDVRNISISDIGAISGMQDFVILLFSINAILFLFNLIPAFPMDGGRIFRALLSLKFNRFKATLIASLTGKIFAIVFVLIGLRYSNYALIIIGIVIYLLADQEIRSDTNQHQYTEEKQA